MIKSTLFLMMLYALTESVSAHTDPWQIRAPSRVRATRGSCVVIPCSFSYPTHMKPTPPSAGALRGLWSKNIEKVVVSSSRKTTKLHKDYRGRTSFIGNMTEKDCTWMLIGVGDSDAGKYFFRTDSLAFWKYRHSWGKTPTELQVINADPPMVHLDEGFEEGKLWGVCSLVHSCHTHTPELTWTHGKQGEIFFGQIDDCQWITYNQIFFTTHNESWAWPQEIECVAMFYGGQTLRSESLSIPLA